MEHNNPICRKVVLNTYTLFKGSICNWPLTVICANLSQMCWKDIINKDIPSKWCITGVAICGPLVGIAAIGGLMTPEQLRSMGEIPYKAVRTVVFISKAPSITTTAIVEAVETAVFGWPIKPIVGGQLIVVIE